MTTKSYTTLDDPAGANTVINSISGNTVAGYYYTSVRGSVPHGFIYNGSSFTTFDYQPGNNSIYTFITGVDRSNVVGFITDISGVVGVDSGFFFDGSKFTLFSSFFPGSVSGDYIVGSYGTSNLNSRGMLYNITTGNSTIFIDPLAHNPAIAGSMPTTANSISGTYIVGSYTGGGQHAYLLDTSTSTYTTIDPPNSSWAEATAVDGNIVGGVYLGQPGGSTHDQGFIAVVPEPTGITLAIAGCVGFAVYVQCRLKSAGRALG